MRKLATWMRPKDAKWFDPIFARHSDLEVLNAMEGPIELGEATGLLLTGGPDVAPGFLRQEVPDPSILDKSANPIRDAWEMRAIEHALERGLPVLAICKGMQIFNVALGGTLKLDIPGHNAPEMREQEVQRLRYDQCAGQRFELVNSAHHQAVDGLGDGLAVEAWSVDDDIVEQFRLRNYPYAIGVQYHPERGPAYAPLFKDFISRLNQREPLYG